eukprot:TRINITY_DN2957_c0_g3_i2.p1 TRINITY_DN2957_c0_g3~~TRINITY_DN2957_c0_g3_i2.p1  ORF type:complete len:892 (+),score=388.98 TRINITY_DN2957_c0_g3_i2:164-2839(+)
MILLFLAFALGGLSTLFLFRYLASNQRSLLYQILSIDSSFVHSSKDAVPVILREPISVSSSHPTIPTIDVPITAQLEPLNDFHSNSSVSSEKNEELLLPEQSIFNSTPTTSSASLTQRRTRGVAMYDDSTSSLGNHPLQTTNSSTDVSSSDEKGHYHSSSELRGSFGDKTASNPSLTSKPRPSSLTTTPLEVPKTTEIKSDRPGHHKSPSVSHGKGKTPVVERASSYMTDEKARQKAELLAFTQAEKFVGWVEVGSIMAKKLKWRWRYAVIQGGWMHYYKDELTRANSCCGWVLVAGNMVYERQKRNQQIVIKNPRGKRIFRRHGPDPSVPPAKKDGFFFGHRKSAKCRLRFKEKDVLQLWLEMLKKAAAVTTATTVIDSDDENEILGGDTSSDDGSIRSSDEEMGNPLGRSGHSQELTSSSEVHSNTSNISVEGPHVIQPTGSQRRIARGDSLIIVRPDKTEEVPAPRSYIESRRNSQQFGYVSVSSPAPVVPGRVAPSTEVETLNAPEGEEALEESVSSENREGLGKILAKAIGLDLTTIALPVTLNEPQSFLQRMCEAVQYYELLNKADTFDDPVHRMAYVASFAVTAYSCNTRTTKPFNPYLGETFELVRPDGFKYLGEQVSHHPPVGAGNATSPHFDFYEEQGIKSKFGGNSLNCETIGQRRLTLKTRGDSYTWGGIKTVVHNILLGEMWIDHYGRAEITCGTTKCTAILEFTKCGWFSKGRYEVKGWIADASGKTCINLEGKWVEQLEATVLHGANFPGTSSSKHIVWKHTSLPDDPDYKYKFSPFCKEMNRIDPGMESYLPTTDSRLRKDRIALGELDIKKAGAEKRMLEERERRLRKTRETKGVIWKPKYYTLDSDNTWAPTNVSTYWNERSQRKISSASPLN